MKPLLTLVYAYYENKGMLQHQVDVWQNYSAEVLERCQFIITDDCSKRDPLSDSLPLKGIPYRAFRITKKVPWNWLACRNIGAYYASGRWILMTDMDHVLEPVRAQLLFNMIKSETLDKSWVYLFTRVNADGSKYKPHDDSFLMTKKLFWKIGGYDEELSGNYGTSGRYRSRAFMKSNGNERLSIPLTRFSRNDISDASTTDFPRKEGRDPRAIMRIEQLKKSQGRSDSVRVLSFPYEELKK